MKYRVKEGFIDRFYGNSPGEYVEVCQENGIPNEDLEFLISEWGEEAVMEMLEEV